MARLVLTWVSWVSSVSLFAFEPTGDFSGSSWQASISGSASEARAAWNAGIARRARVTLGSSGRRLWQTRSESGYKYEMGHYIQNSKRERERREICETYGSFEKIEGR